jgi:hypothetical protein
MARNESTKILGRLILAVLTERSRVQIYVGT